MARRPARGAGARKNFFLRLLVRPFVCFNAATVEVVESLERTPETALAIEKPGEDGRRARGIRTHEAILEKAVQVASAEGLEGLTIGRLATELGVSKSGLFAHFGSKTDLQLATVAAARRILITEGTGGLPPATCSPCAAGAPGRPRHLNARCAPHPAWMVH